MKRIIILLAVVSAMLAATASTAHSDPGTTQATCGANDPSGGNDAKSTDVFPNNGVWTVDIGWFCGPGKTFMFEIQRKANSGSNWTDVAGTAGAHHWWTSPGGCSTGCLRRFFVTGGCVQSSYDYRVVVYNDNGRAYARQADYWCS